MIRPIIFNTEMVRAILDGRKTVTRRAIKPKYRDDEYGFQVCHNADWSYWYVEKMNEDGGGFDDTRYVHPPCQTGDVLYVRETWGIGYDGYIYKADDKLANHPSFQSSTKMLYRPSIHMPKEAARIWLKVTNVQVQRIQEMTLQDSLKEGVKLSLRGMVETNGADIDAVNKETTLEIHGITSEGKRGALAPFIDLWNSTVPKKDLSVYGWNANPWVWVISFERIRKEEVPDV